LGGILVAVVIIAVLALKFDFFSSKATKPQQGTKGKETNKVEEESERAKKKRERQQVLKQKQKEQRDSWGGNKVMRYRLRKDGTVEETNLLPNDPKSLFELPVIDPRLYAKKKACVSWFWQGACNAYDEDIHSTKVGPAGAWALAKRNFCTGERLGWYAPNEYPSEVAFIPNPESSEEDNGALVGIVFDANRNSSYVHIRDAQTLTMIARADLPIKVPFLVHASWFQDNTIEQDLVV